MTEPDVCICGRQATGIGFTKPDRWICNECVPILEYVKSVRRPSVYETKARRGGVEAMAPIIEEFGTDLGAYTEEQADMLAGAAWRGTADRMRELIRNGEAPF